MRVLVKTSVRGGSYPSIVRGLTLCDTHAVAGMNDY